MTKKWTTAVTALCLALGLTGAGAGSAQAATAGQVAAHRLTPRQPAFSGANMLTSGTFEGSIAGWQKLVPAGGIVNWANYNTLAGAPAPAYDGTGYLATNTNIVGGSVYQDVPITLGSSGTVEASVFLSSQSGPATGTFCLWGLISGSNPISTCSGYSVNSSTGYGNYILITQIPVGVTTLRFQIYPTANGGTTDLDDASLFQIG
ncbi:hypothetical protein C7C46_24010 [Streptomyces tateyamensis]|uniref:Uncharacterized protein n=1 Tax=Streptomyces tateyamensis TaxID=565073 RepID=A0A2V4N3U4_9ACTN|nr:hypothetical protein [Streptomyces tateyamensis]PYC74482.1 hypothetical protein C7C46_24010 [Streptomyces tateyamensis]